MLVTLGESTNLNHALGRNDFIVFAYKGKAYFKFLSLSGNVSAFHCPRLLCSISKAHVDFLCGSCCPQFLTIEQLRRFRNVPIFMLFWHIAYLYGFWLMEGPLCGGGVCWATKILFSFSKLTALYSLSIHCFLSGPCSTEITHSSLYFSHFSFFILIFCREFVLILSKTCLNSIQMYFDEHFFPNCHILGPFCWRTCL